MLKKIKKWNIIKMGYRGVRRSLSKISPEIATKVMYRVSFGKKIDLVEPKSFNEKLQWIKLNWRHDLKSICADKYEVGIYAKEHGCNEIINKVYTVYNSVEEIEWDNLPDKFALKCTHGCGANIICDNKLNLDKDMAIKKLNKWMLEDYSLEYAEIHYKKIKPRIICEEYLEDGNGKFPLDYKIFCFNGKPKVTMVCYDREKGKTKYFLYNNKWKIQPYNQSGKTVIKNKSNGYIDNKPKSFDSMLKYCEKLASPFPFVRIDFYEINGQPILGEMTFTPCGCLDKNLTIEAEKEMGEFIKLPTAIK